MLQMGNFTEAAVALEGRFSRGEAHLIAGALHAPSIVALGTLKIHTADESGALEVAEIAKIMLQARAPGVRHHAMWYLALLAYPRATRCKRAGGSAPTGMQERLSMFPLYPHEVTYDANAYFARRSETRSSQNTESRSLNDVPASSRGPFMRRGSIARPRHLEGLRRGSRARGVALPRRTSSPGPRVRARRPRPGAGATRRQRAGHRRARRGTTNASASAPAGCGSVRVPASPARRATAAGQNRSAQDRVGGTDRSRVRGRQSCRARVHQPGDR